MPEAARSPASPTEVGVELGCACIVPSRSAAAAYSKSEVAGVLLEVRQLWVPPSEPNSTIGLVQKQQSSDTHTSQPAKKIINLSFQNVKNEPSAPHKDTPVPQLYGFVHIKDANRRLSGWYPLDQIQIKVRASETMNLESKSTSNEKCSASDLISQPILSDVYTSVTPGMARTQRAERLLDYFDERLLRDGKSPTTIRCFIYAQQFMFSPWYYAPYGLLHPSYDPMRSVPVETFASMQACTSSHAVKEENDKDHEGSESHLASSPPLMDSKILASALASMRYHRNPYIRDAYLCPFSLRVYPTWNQLRYEIETYRNGASEARSLHPPGLKIYEDLDQGIALFEVNGSQHVTYCRHLFLIGKSFLEKKLAGHDVHNYYFYVLCLHHRYFPHFFQLNSDGPGLVSSAKASNHLHQDENAWLFAGYFSWEKNVEECNLACIVTLPCFGVQAAAQKTGTPSVGGASSLAGPPTLPKGLGQFMIRVSYELSYRRGRRVGTPERPLSDLGAAAYLRYWGTMLLEWWYHHLPSEDAFEVNDDSGNDSTEDEVRVIEVRRRPGRPARRLEYSSTESSRGSMRGKKDMIHPCSRSDRGGLPTEASLSTEGMARVPAKGLGSSDICYSVEGVAKRLGIETEDALRTVLHLGLLQWSRENRRVEWALPRDFIRRKHQRFIQRREDGGQRASYATFSPRLLLPKGQSYQTSAQYWETRDSTSYF